MTIVWVILTTSQQQTFRHAWFWLHLRRFVKQNHDREAVGIMHNFIGVYIYLFFLFSGCRFGYYDLNYAA